MLLDVDTPDPTSTVASPPRPPFEGRRLRRRPDDGHIGGVCAGLADYLGLDITVVRLAAVLLAVIGPGVPAYIVAWIVMPPVEPGTPPQTAARATDLGERVPQYVGAGLVVLAIVIVWDRLDWPGDRFFFPLALIGAGIVLLTRTPLAGAGDGPPPTPPGPYPPTPPTSPSPSSWAPPGPAVEPTTVLPPPPPPPPTTTFDDEYEPAPPAPPAPPRRRSPVTGAFVGLALVWGGIAVMVDVAPETGLAVAVGILGAGLVIGAFAGGARGLIFPGVALSLLLVGTAVLDVPLRGGIGERNWDVARVADVDGPFRLGIGEGVLDLRDLRPGAERTVEIEATVGIGHLQVLLPERVDVTIEADADLGEVRVLGDGEGGGDVHVEEELDLGPSSAGTIELRLGVGIGQVEILR
jgi:phage shock protein PspC (stress-responsive transcriptional regulator)